MIEQNYENESQNLSGEAARAQVEETLTPDVHGGQNLIEAAAGAGVEVPRKDVGDGKLSTSTGGVSDELISSLRSELRSELQLQREEMERQHHYMQQQLGEIKSLILSITPSCSTAHPNQIFPGPSFGCANDEISVVRSDKAPPQHGKEKVEWRKIRKEPADDKGIVGSFCFPADCFVRNQEGP
jgi:hypothetical protein